MTAIIAALLGAQLVLAVVIALLVRDANHSAARYHRERIDHAHTRAQLHILSLSLDPTD